VTVYGLIGVKFPAVHIFFLLQFPNTFWTTNF